MSLPLPNSVLLDNCLRLPPRLTPISIPVWQPSLFNAKNMKEYLSSLNNEIDLNKLLINTDPEIIINCAKRQKSKITKKIRKATKYAKFGKS